MAHTCPECGQLCHCSGDWDDIDFGEWSNCQCPCCWEDEDDFDDDYEDDFDDDDRNDPNDSRNI